jgi:Neurotransmitter-gated ion-channel ligand binding domain
MKTRPFFIVCLHSKQSEYNGIVIIDQQPEENIMKSTRLFFVGILLLCLSFLAATVLPETVHANPKTITTGEYPDAIGARCTDVKYGNKIVESQSVEGMTSVTPPNPSGATLVYLGMYVNEITDVDEGANSYRMQGYMDMIWCDPRLAFTPTDNSIQAEIFLEEDAYAKLGNMWWPNPEFMNEEEAVSPENLVLMIHPDGTVEYRAQINALLASDFNLHAFPFDNQDLTVEIESFEWAGDTMTFLTQGGVVGFSDEFRIPEWNVTGISENVASKKEIRDHNEFSQFVAKIHIARDPGVYTTKVMIPLGIIILISMIIFWMDADAFEDRLGALMTGLLTAVAYQFIASQNLPKHVYNTFLDSYVFLSFLVILFGIGESAYVGWLVKNEKEAEAKQVDQISRWFIPLLYIVMIVTLYFVYTR